MQVVAESTTHTHRVPVKLIRDELQARLIFDPMRREILRLLSCKARTEKQLSDAIGISPPSVAHHLNALKRGELISLTKKEVGSHGIVQKWYTTTAETFIVDRDRLPNKVRRYFMPMDVERTRGIMAGFSLLDRWDTSTEQMETLTRRFCTTLARIASQYTGGLQGDPEKVIHTLYVETLKQMHLLD